MGEKNEVSTKKESYAQTIAIKKDEAKSLMSKDQLRKCGMIIHSSAVATGAEAFVPIPFADAIPISATQIAMVFGLGKIFDQKLSETAAKGIIAAAASTIVGRTAVKLIPVAGWIASSAVATGITEAIGWTVAVDFANQLHKDEINKSDVHERSEKDCESSDNMAEESNQENDEGNLEDEIDKAFEEEE